MTLENNTSVGGEVVDGELIVPKVDASGEDIIKVEASVGAAVIKAAKKEFAPVTKKGEQDDYDSLDDVRESAVDAELIEGDPVITPEPEVSAPESSTPEAVDATAPELTTAEATPVTSTPDTTTPVVPPIPGTSDAVPPTPELTEAEKLEAINTELEGARSTYATQLIAWKNAQRSEKNVFKKLLSDLGFEKQKPEAERSQELRDAESAYVLAKKKKSQTIPEREIQVMREETAPGAPREVETKKVLDTEALLNMSDAEYAELQKKISESLPPLEKGIALKALEKWSKLPRAAKIGGSAAIMGLITYGTAGLGAAAVVGGKKILKSVIGTGMSQGVGAAVQHSINKNNEAREQERKEGFKSEINLDNFEEVENKMMRAREEFENLKKRQKIRKAGAMLVAGAGTTAALNHVLNSSAEAVLQAAGMEDSPVGSNIDSIHDVPPSSGVDTAHIDGVDASHVVDPGGVDGVNNFDTNGAEDHVGTVESAGDATEKAYNVADVELSSKGFIQSISDLKAKVVEQYGGEEYVPADIKANLLDKSSTDLAKTFGFYDPEHGLSGMGMKGETLSLDSHGNVVYHDLGGSDHVMLDAEHHTTGHFDGKMFNPEDSKPGHPYNPDQETGYDEPEDPDLTRHIEPGVDTDSPDTGTEGMTDGQNGLDADNLQGDSLDNTTEGVVSAVPYHATEVIGGQNYDVTHIPTGNTFVNVLESSDHSKEVMFDGYKIGHENMVGDFGKTLVLDDKFQDGPQYTEVRQAFASALKESEGPLQATYRGHFFSRNAVVDSMEFEGGRIHVLQGVTENNPNSMSVFLNGKEIAKGVITQDGPKIKLLDQPGMKGGWFRGDTAYERAFKQVKTIADTRKWHELSQ